MFSFGSRQFRLAAGFTALAACLVVATPTEAVGPATKRVSVSSSEGQANSNSFWAPSISADGRLVAFPSYASNLVARDANHASDVFVRDRHAGTTKRVSISTEGLEGNGHSLGGSISADGRYVAFWSKASDLVAHDTNGRYDVFVRDLHAGTTERVSVSSAETQATRRSIGSSISADGRYVAFSSRANDLVASDTNDIVDVFVRDRQTGTTTRVSSAETNGGGGPTISADGRFVAFTCCTAPNPFPERSDVFVYDRQAGTTKRVSIGLGGAQGDSFSVGAYISANGRYVAFTSLSSNLVQNDTNNDFDVFVRDRHAGTTKRVSVSSTEGQSSLGSTASAISADGRYVTFSSYSNDLVGGDTNHTSDIFIRDRLTGTTKRVSISTARLQANGYSYASSMSADGRYVVFQSEATNLVATDTNGKSDLFVRGPLH